MITFLFNNTKDRHIIRDLFLSAEEAAKRRGRRLSWLSYAKRTTLKGYAFFSDRHAQEEVLHEIIAKVAHKHPDCRIPKLIDLLSEMINTSEDDLSKLKMAI